MNLKQLQYFSKLADTEHYRKAAEELYITEPSLNRAIRELENELGLSCSKRRGAIYSLINMDVSFCPMCAGLCRSWTRVWIS